jgi:hypothetical protein
MRPAYQICHDLSHILDPRLKQESLIQWLKSNTDLEVLYFLDFLFEQTRSSSRIACEISLCIPYVLSFFKKNIHLQWYFGAKKQEQSGALYYLYPYLFADINPSIWTDSSTNIQVHSLLNINNEVTHPKMSNQVKQNQSQNKSQNESLNESKVASFKYPSPPQIRPSNALNQALEDCLNFDSEESGLIQSRSLYEEREESNDQIGLTLGEKRFLAKSNQKRDFELLYTESDPLIINNLMNRSRLKENDLLRILARTPQNPFILEQGYLHSKWGRYLLVQEALLFNPYTPLKYRSILALKLDHILKKNQKNLYLLPPVLKEYLRK